MAEFDLGVIQLSQVRVTVKAVQLSLGHQDVLSSSQFGRSTNLPIASRVEFIFDSFDWSGTKGSSFDLWAGATATEEASM